MPKCQNCGSHVTEDYVTIFCPEGQTHPKACPHCEDLTRVGTEIREKGTYAKLDEDEYE